MYATRFDIDLLTERLLWVTSWLRDQRQTQHLAPGYFGASTGAAAVLRAAVSVGAEIAAVVSRGGSPDLAELALAQVHAPILLLVGGNGGIVLRLNRQALSQLPATKELVVVSGATHLFEEPGTLEEVARLATVWFQRFFQPKSA